MTEFLSFSMQKNQLMQIKFLQVAFGWEDLSIWFQIHNNKSLEQFGLSHLKMDSNPGLSFSVFFFLDIQVDFKSKSYGVIWN